MPAYFSTCAENEPISVAMRMAPATAVPKAPPRLLMARERPEISLCLSAETAPWVMFMSGALTRPMPMPATIMPGRKAHWSTVALSSIATKRMPPENTSMPIWISSLGATICVSLLTQIVAPTLLIQIGMLVFSGGILLVDMELKATVDQWAFLPGMIVAGIGIGLVNAPLMNMTQGAVSADKQSEISGLSRAMSNLGGAFGTAVAGAILM